MSSVILIAAPPYDAKAWEWTESVLPGLKEAGYDTLAVESPPGSPASPSNAQTHIPHPAPQGEKRV